jgi:hypothetical protein
MVDFVERELNIYFPTLEFTLKIFLLQRGARETRIKEKNVFISYF